MQPIRVTVRIFLLSLLAFYYFAIPMPSQAGTQDCDYDRLRPSLESAKISSRAGNHKCAAAELNDLLAIDTIPDRLRADAHIWLGMMYYRLLKDSIAAHDSVLTQFMMALEKYPTYSGELDEDTTTLGGIFKDARRKLADQASWNEKKTADSVRTICDQYSNSRRKNTMLKIASGVLTAGAVVGAVLYNSKANDAYDEYHLAVSPDDIESSWNRYNSKYKTRNVLIGVAVAAVMSEIIWFITAPESPDIDCRNNLKKPTDKMGVIFDGQSIQLSIIIPGT